MIRACQSHIHKSYTMQDERLCPVVIHNVLLSTHRYQSSIVLGIGCLLAPSTPPVRLLQ